MKTGGRQAYFATARITNIIEDPSKPDHFYALVEDFVPLDHTVPYKKANHYYERAAQRRRFHQQRGFRSRCPKHFRRRV